MSISTTAATMSARCVTLPPPSGSPDAASGNFTREQLRLRVQGKVQRRPAVPGCGTWVT